MENTTDSKKKAPMHVMENLLYNDELIGEEVNQIIEEIMAILIKQKITITTAKHILQDASNALERECILEKRKINGEIISTVQSFREENVPDVRSL